MAWSTKGHLQNNNKLVSNKLTKNSTVSGSFSLYFPLQSILGVADSREGSKGDENQQRTKIQGKILTVLRARCEMRTNFQALS